MNEITHYYYYLKIDQIKLIMTGLLIKLTNTVKF